MLQLAARAEKKKEVARTRLKELVEEFAEDALFASDLVKLSVPPSAAIIPEEFILTGQKVSQQPPPFVLLPLT